MRADRGGGPVPGAVHLRGVHKAYPGVSRFRFGTSAGAEPDGRPMTTTALGAIDLDVDPGETVGILGPNGAGKTTLLRIVAGVTTPTRGTVGIGGRVTSMIDLGMGFHPEMNGWDNVECSALLLGLRRRELGSLRPEIVEFAGLGAAIDRPLRTYSTGMRARLGFAVATHVPSDVLVIDEVLAVGDREFQIACVGRVAELAAQGTTLLFVSHEMPLIAQMCRRAVHLRHGAVVDDGDAREVVERYLRPEGRRHTPERDASLRLRSFELLRTEIEPWQPVEVSMTVEVGDASVRPQVALDLSLPTFEPDNVFLSTIDDLPGVNGPGTYSFVGTSDPYPGDSGQIRITANLIDATAYRTRDVGVLDFELPLAAVTRPRLALRPRWEIGPLTTPAPSGGHGRSADRSGDEEALPAAGLRGVVKRYRARADHRDRAVFAPTERISALGPCDATVRRGEVTGVIGPNGAGKSTLLRVLAGVTTPDEGTIERSGRVVPVLELGLGFHPDLSGRHNLEIAARLLGFDRRQLAERFDDIVAFAGLVDLIDQAVRTYSTGMVARLGLSLALHVEPDLLLLDEILAVGDEDFRRRAIRRIRRLASEGTAIVFVSHDLRLVEEICDRVIRLEAGRVTDEGAPDEVIARFGGRGWAAGTLAAPSDIRVHELRLARRHLPADAELSFDGTIEVAEGSPHARVELSLRVPLDDRSRELDRSEFESRCFFVATVEPAGGALSTPGWMRFAGGLERIPFAGVEMDVVISVIDGRDGTVLSEHWQETSVGRIEPGEMPRPLFRFDWKPITPERPDDARGPAPRRRK